MADEIARPTVRQAHARSEQRRGATPIARALVYAMFLVIVAVTIWVPFYNRIEPTWQGIPFFYWFQVSWIVVTALATVLAYRLKL